MRYYVKADSHRELTKTDKDFTEASEKAVFLEN